MDSPLAPVLTNIFMGFYETKWLNEYNLNKVELYLIYVDDILAAFEKEENSFKFTIEKQVNHYFAFLDIFISGIDNQNFTL